MKFYKRFPGDIMKKTSGLTMAQFGAYDRLIDWCYANEKPVDPDEVYTITHAQTPADRRDVDKVLAKFFTKEADGYRQERVEEIIAEALPKIEAARENGKKGGRPKKTTEPKPTGLSEETNAEPEAKTSQEPDSPSLRSGEGRASRLPKPFELPEEWATWAVLERPELDPRKVGAKFADYWHGKAGKDGRKLDWTATWRNWVREERAPTAARPVNGKAAPTDTVPSSAAEATQALIAAHVMTPEQEAAAAEARTAFLARHKPAGATQ